MSLVSLTKGLAKNPSYATRNTQHETRNTQHGTHIAMPSPFQLAPSSPTVQLHLPDGRALTGPRGGEGGSRDACQQGADRNIAGVDQQRNPAGRVFGEARETTCENGKVIWP